MNKYVFLIILVFIVPFTVWAGGLDKPIFTIEDPAGDDFGPGTYEYPTHNIFYEKGIFDILKFSIFDNDSKYVLSFKFNKLIDPWESKFGFSMPLLQLYIDNKEGGISELFREGANVRLSQKYPWDIFLKISGWWIRAYRPGDKGKEVDFWNTDENPWDVKGAKVLVEDNNILVHIERKVIGQLDDARIYLIVGSFDPFGPDHFRSIGNKTSSWNFADKVSNNLDYAPRVIDIILPEGMEQEKVLSKFQENYPDIYPISTKNTIFSTTSVHLYYYFVIFLILVFLILFIVNKKIFIRNNKN